MPVIDAPTPAVADQLKTAPTEAARKAAEAPKPIRSPVAEQVHGDAIEKAKAAQDTPTTEQGGKVRAFLGEAKEGASAEGSHLKVDLSDANQAKIREIQDPQKVGPDKYGKSLVKQSHKDEMNASEHEEAQAKAYDALSQKIQEGLVDPAQVPTEICMKLGVTSELGTPPESYDGIVGQVASELDTFKNEGHLNEQEYNAILKEVTTFTKLYGEAYGTEDIAKTYELVRDNARKLTYQNSIDKQVFNGSDHGTRHILDGNTKFAEQLIQSLRENGVVVSAKDQLLVHQTMIDHDVGYTTGAALAKNGFDAQKDHPLVSAKVIEANKAYYVDKFGQDGYAVIQDAVLNHSYPRLEYQSDGTDAIHPDLVRGITSTVDSLGVTVETKTPEFFWNGDVMKTLIKIRLAQDTIGLKPGLMDQYKDELRAIADKEQILTRREDYRKAIDNFFGTVTADNTLGHYTGVVRSVQVEQVSVDGDHTQEEPADDHQEDSEHDHGHNKLRVVVNMSPTEVYALVGNMFGDKLAQQSFKKAMEDLKLDPKALETYTREVRQAKLRGEAAPAPLEVAHENARVVVGNETFEDLTTEQRAASGIAGAESLDVIKDVFPEVEMLSIRGEINELLDQVDNGQGRIDIIAANFMSMISDKTTAEEINHLADLVVNLSDTSVAETSADGTTKTVSEIAKQTLKKFLTQNERAFLGVDEQGNPIQAGTETELPKGT